MYGARLLLQQAVGNFKGITVATVPGASGSSVSPTAVISTPLPSEMRREASGAGLASRAQQQQEGEGEAGAEGEAASKAREEEYERELRARVLQATNPQAAAALAPLPSAPGALGSSSPAAAAAGVRKQRTIKKTLQVTPTPIFVMKSKKPSGEKVFINVCTHKDLRDGSEVFLSGVKQFADKTGGNSAVYDAVVGVSLASLEEVQAQEALGQRIIRAVNEKYEQQLDIQFTTPKTKNDYKGDVVTDTAISVETLLPEEEQAPPSVKLERGVSSKGGGKEGGSGGAGAGTGEGFITPKPGVVIKCRNTSSSANTKIFINVCTHDSIPNKERPVLLTGPSRSYSVVGEDPALIYDAVVHPRTLGSITQLKDATLKDAKLREVLWRSVGVSVSVECIYTRLSVCHPLMFHCYLHIYLYPLVVRQGDQGIEGEGGAGPGRGRRVHPAQQRRQLQVH